MQMELAPIGPQEFWFSLKGSTGALLLVQRHELGAKTGRRVRPQKRENDARVVIQVKILMDTGLILALRKEELYPGGYPCLLRRLAGSRS